jgi:hypothetical protein
MPSRSVVVLAWLAFRPFPTGPKELSEFEIRERMGFGVEDDLIQW